MQTCPDRFFTLQRSAKKAPEDRPLELFCGHAPSLFAATLASLACSIASICADNKRDTMLLKDLFCRLAMALALTWIDSGTVTVILTAFSSMGDCLSIVAVILHYGYCSSLKLMSLSLVCSLITIVYNGFSE